MARGRATGRTEAIGAAARGRREWWSADLSRRGGITRRIRAWCAAEVVPGRLMPWLPVAFGTGIVIYFAAEREPWPSATIALAVACGALAFVARRRPVAFPILLGVAAMAAGFANVTVKSARVAHPILHAPVWNAALSGWIEAREERERSDRVVIRVHHITAKRLGAAPGRVRLAVRKGTAPAVGSFVELKAHLNPPLGPLRPGGYDFARDLYFQGIGAIGFALGRIKVTPSPQDETLRLRFAALIDGIRSAIDRRIREAVPGDAGSIASALITGRRDAISAPVNDAMYVSSLAHVLSISGYHIAVVAGIMFFAVRALLALVPGVAIRRPIKKWAACAALVATALYVVLSGAEVATQRAFIMTAIVLLGVMVDRPALTLRTLAVAALGVMAVAPEAVVHPSFQMSFAATLALVAGYRFGLAFLMPAADTSRGARIALWGGREVVMLILASLVAGSATMLYAAYHFHRLAPYGVLANLLAMPVISGLSMPAGILALLAMPFGFDTPLWQLMGLGIDWMIAVALWVAHLPGAVGRVTAFGVGPLLVGTAGLIVLSLLKTPLRWSGALLMAGAIAGAAATRQPDIFIGEGGRAVAVRQADGRLAIVVAPRVRAFAVREWLAADADARHPDDRALADGFRCDDDGCVSRLDDGTVVAVARMPEAFADDCRRAALVITSRQGPPDCNAAIVDRSALPYGATLAMQRTPGGFSITSTRPRGTDRPWARAAPDPHAAASPAGSPAAKRHQDATPRPEDLGADDGPASAD